MHGSKGMMYIGLIMIIICYVCPYLYIHVHWSIVVFESCYCNAC